MHAKVFHSLGPRPAELVNAGIHYQAYGAELLTGQLTEAAVRIAIEAELRPQRFRVQRPALNVCAVAIEAPNLGERR